MVAARRPAKSVRMNRSFLVAFVDFARKEHAEDYGRADLLHFRDELRSKDYAAKYVDTQINFVLTFFKHHLRMCLSFWVERKMPNRNVCAPGAHAPSTWVMGAHP